MSDPTINPVQLFHNYLSEHQNEDQVIILDNVDDITILEEDLGFESVKFVDLIPRASRAKVIVTTRDRRVGERLAARGSTVSVGTMDISNSIHLLKSYLPSDKPTSKPEQEELVKSLDCLPLAITQAAAYITEECLSLGEYLSLLQESDEQFEELLSESLSDDRRYQQEGNSPIKTWKISFDHILKIGRRASEMLSLMAFFDRNHIQSNLLRRKSESNILFLKAAGILESFSLISKLPTGDAYRMHKLVQVATQAWVRVQKSTPGVRLVAITKLATLFPSGEYETWRECEALLPHTRFIMPHSHESSDTSLQYANLLTKVAWFYRCQTRYQMSIDTAGEAREIYRRIRGWRDPGAHSNTITEIDNQMSRFEFASLDGCIGTLREICSSLDTQLGEEDPESLRAWGNLAWALHCDAQIRKIIPEEAIFLFRNILPIRERVLGVDHPRSMTTMNNLGLALGEKFELLDNGLPPDDMSDEDLQAINTESLGLLRECLHRRLQYSGPDHPDTLEIQGNLGCTLYARGTYVEAEQLLRSTIASRVALFGYLQGESVPYLSALAKCLSEQGAEEEAIEVAQKTVSFAEDIFGPTHMETLINRNNYANILRQAKRYNDAVQVCQRMLMDTMDYDNHTWPGAKKSRNIASKRMVVLSLNKWPSPPSQPSVPIYRSRFEALVAVISQGISGWRRSDLNDVQMIRLLVYAPENVLDRLDPLPPEWEIRLSQSYKIYFANKSTQATIWQDPRDADAEDDELIASPAFDSEHVIPTRELRDPPEEIELDAQTSELHLQDPD